LINSGNEIKRTLTNFFIYGIRFTDLKGLRTLKTLNALSEGKLESPIFEIIKSNRLIQTIKKSKIFQ